MSLNTEPAQRITQRLFEHHYPIPAHDVISEILDGLRQSPKKVSSKYFYNSEGARLFDRITALPEYYLTRVERQIYRDNAEAIAAAAGTGRIVIEPGSGSSEKIRLLMDALRPQAYVPLDITASHLREAALSLVREYPWLSVHAVRADYTAGIELPHVLPSGDRLIFFPGSTIGNFEPQQALAFLRMLRELAGQGGALLIGIDLKKDQRVLHAAYNDAEQVTAKFNANALRHVNEVADANFSLDNFQHRAFYNSEQGRIEMHLESLSTHTVTVAGEGIQLAKGERIHTENSYKYRIEEFLELAVVAGFAARDHWCDGADYFSVQLLDCA